MNQKYHINKRGVPALCHAKEGNCPLGEESGHYSSIEEAEDARDRIFEEEFGTLAIINSEDINSNEDVRSVARKINSAIKEKGVDTKAVRDFRDKVVSASYIKYTKHPESLQVNVAKFSGDLNNFLDKNYALRRDNIDSILNVYRKVESEYNSKMKKDISKQVTEINDRSLEGSGDISLLGGKDTSHGGILSGGIRARGSSKKQVVEKRDSEMSSRDLRENRKRKKHRDKLEVKKEHRMFSLNHKLSLVSSYNKESSRIINEDLGERVDLIRDPDNKRQALVYLEDLDNLQSKTYVSNEDRMILTQQFRDANESKDEVEMRSCNRLVNMLGPNDRIATSYLDSRVNAITFEENYERFESGEIFETKSREEFRSELLEIRNNLINCFDVR